MNIPNGSNRWESTKLHDWIHCTSKFIFNLRLMLCVQLRKLDGHAYKSAFCLFACFERKKLPRFCCKANWHLSQIHWTFICYFFHHLHQEETENYGFIFIVFLWLWNVFMCIPESYYVVSRHYHLRHRARALEKLTQELPLLFRRRDSFPFVSLTGIPGSQGYLGF